MDNAIHWINRYPVDSTIVCPNSYLLDRIYLVACSRRSDSRVRESSNRRARAKLARSPPSERGSLLSERQEQTIYTVDCAIHFLNIRGQDNTCVTNL